jgi:methyl-accepting chemotaxis protein
MSSIRDQPRTRRAASGGVVGAVTAVAAFLTACASAPRATVELAEIVDEQITEMQKSHEAFVRLYYDGLRGNVDAFVDEVWTPHFLEKTLSGETEQSRRFLRELEGSFHITSIDPTAVEDTRSTLGQVMLGYARATREEIEAQRRSLHAPIDAQERVVLTEIRDGYADILRGHTAVKAHLAAVADVVEERDEILRRVGLLQTQREIVQAAVDANDQTVEAIERVGDAQEAIDAFRERMAETLERLRDLRDGSDHPPEPAPE